MAKTVRIGVIGAGGIFRDRHFPALAGMDDVTIEVIANRSVESASEIAEEFDLGAEASESPQEVIESDVDAVMVGTWPYKHRHYALAALDADKHVFVQARMARTLHEAKEMYWASEESDRVTQICPSPLAMKGDQVVKDLLADGYVGDVHLIRGHVLSGDGLDPESPLHWRDVEHYQGVNALQVGILAERLHRWFGHAETVSARTQIRVPERPLPDGDGKGIVERPDLVSVDAEMNTGAFMSLEFSSLAEHPPDNAVEVYGSEGTLRYEFADDTLYGASVDDELGEIPIEDDDAREWTVETDFVEAVRNGGAPRTTFREGMKYVEFTEAVARSAERGSEVHLPFVT